MNTFESKDPMGKVLHGIRPSQFEKYKKNIEDSFLKHKKHTEATVADVIAKIGTWNSYFGVKEDEEGEGEGGDEGGSVVGSITGEGSVTTDSGGKETAAPTGSTEATAS